MPQFFADKPRSGALLRLAYIFLATPAMKSIGHYSETAKQTFQQGVNCWLSYALAQPVEIDLIILLHFVSVYFGFNIFYNILRRTSQRFSYAVATISIPEPVEKIVSRKNFPSPM